MKKMILLAALAVLAGCSEESYFKADAQDALSSAVNGEAKIDSAYIVKWGGNRVAVCGKFSTSQSYGKSYYHRRFVVVGYQYDGGNRLNSAHASIDDLDNQKVPDKFIKVGPSNQTKFEAIYWNINCSNEQHNPVGTAS